MVGRKILLAGLVVVSVSGMTFVGAAVIGVQASIASASVPHPKINNFSPTAGPVGTRVTIKGIGLAGATKVTFNGKAAAITSDTATKINAEVPAGATTGYIKVKTPGGTAQSGSEFKITLLAAKSVVSDGEGYCALLGSGGVDCWGNGPDGELGNGTFYTTGNEGSATPVEVEGVGGSGTLAGVKSLAALQGADGSSSYCAVLTSGGVDCWGYGADGQLGNGTFYAASPYGSATPVEVEGVGGSGTLAGVKSLVGLGNDNSFCAVLTSGGVDCWGYGSDGELGNGTFYTASPFGSATPVGVAGVGGSGTLTEVASLVALNSDEGYCAVLTSGGVDCWGYGADGELGNGTFYTASPYGSATPVEVEGIGGSGTLTGVSTLVGDFASYCAVLTSGGVDCWGYGADGELGNGTFYTASPYGSATPVEVEGVGGSGTLSGVASAVANDGSYCALLTSGEVDCWGSGSDGQLGNGTFYTTSPFGSSTPVEVEGVGGSGTIGGVKAVSTDGRDSYCALLTSGGVDCWGFGYFGELGDGTFHTTGNEGNAAPIGVEGVGGTGTLAGVKTVTRAGEDSYCAAFAQGGVDCWGWGYYGQLGNGTFYTTGNEGSSTPVGV